VVFVLGCVMLLNCVCFVCEFCIFVIVGVCLDDFVCELHLGCIFAV